MNYFSIMSQIFISYFVVRTIFRESEITYDVTWEQQLTRYIMCIALHFSFQDEVWSAMRLVKYVSINRSQFDRPYLAFWSAFTQFSATVLIEAVNIYNLMTVTTVIDSIFNYLAFSTLARFDTMFISPFIQTRYRVLAGMTIPFRDYQRSHIVIKDMIVMTRDKFDEINDADDSVIQQFNGDFCEYVNEFFRKWEDMHGLKLTLKIQGVQPLVDRAQKVLE